MIVTRKYIDGINDNIAVELNKLMQIDYASMIDVVVGNYMKMWKLVVSQDTTLRQVFEHIGIDYKTGRNYLNGGIVELEELDKTFREFEDVFKFYLINAQKMDGMP